LQEQRQRPLADLQEDAALVLEMHVEGGGGDADLIGDPADGGALIALGDEDALGGLQDLRASEVSVALGLAGGSADGRRGSAQGNPSVP
jgi:hypothetical protein